MFADNVLSPSTCCGSLGSVVFGKVFVAHHLQPVFQLRDLQFINQQTHCPPVVPQVTGAHHCRQRMFF